jgi:hypothetical protein
MKAVDAFNSFSPNFLDSSILSLLASMYSVSPEQLPNECLPAKNVLKDKEAETMFDTSTHLLPLRDAFPTINKLLHVALTVVVSTAQCERSFTTLGRIKSHLRTTITNDRIAVISLLSLERDLCSTDTFIKDKHREFEGADKNRLIILSYITCIIRNKRT